MPEAPTLGVPSSVVLKHLEDSWDQNKRLIPQPLPCVPKHMDQFHFQLKLEYLFLANFRRKGNFWEKKISRWGPVQETAGGAWGSAAALEQIKWDWIFSLPDWHLLSGAIGQQTDLFSVAGAARWQKRLLYSKGKLSTTLVPCHRTALSASTTVNGDVRHELRLCKQI